jgi:hypothetical protein
VDFHGASSRVLFCDAKERTSSDPVCFTHVGKTLAVRKYFSGSEKCRKIVNPNVSMITLVSHAEEQLISQHEFA